MRPHNDQRGPFLLLLGLVMAVLVPPGRWRARQGLAVPVVTRETLRHIIGIGDSSAFNADMVVVVESKSLPNPRCPASEAASCEAPSIRSPRCRAHTCNGPQSCGQDDCIRRQDAPRPWPCRQPSDALAQGPVVVSTPGVRPDVLVSCFPTAETVASRRGTRHSRSGTAWHRVASRHAH